MFSPDESSFIIKVLYLKYIIYNTVDNVINNQNKNTKTFKVRSIVILFNQVLYVDKMKHVGYNL